jgi:sialidase-1
MKPKDPRAVEQTELFVSGRDGYHTYRIPSLLVTASGAVLAICEARKHSGSDTGDIDLVLRRSTDGGLTWDRMRVIADAGTDVIDNPCPVQDSSTGTIWMPVCWNAAQGGEDKIVKGQARRDVWIMKSEDDGESWSEPADITAQAKRPDWTWYATGPGHGIQLRGGRLLVPCDFGRGEPDREHVFFGSHVLLSDDHGARWRVGGAIQGKVNECQAVELPDGTVYLNMRSYHGRNRRAAARSTDGGESWSEVTLDEALIEPVCQAGLVGIGDGGVLFSNPASTKRECMTVRSSSDGCRRWERSLVLHTGPSAYSDLAVTVDGTVLCLYERGSQNAYETITLARFRPEAIA